jgi:hypothetical protein
MSGARRETTIEYLAMENAEGAALAKNSDQVGLVGLVRAAERKQRLVHIQWRLPHAVVADRDGELPRPPMEVECDRQVLPDLIDKRTLLYSLVVFQALNRIHLREAEIPKHGIPRRCWVHGGRILQELAQARKFDQRLHPVDQALRERVHRLARCRNLRRGSFMAAPLYSEVRIANVTAQGDVAYWPATSVHPTDQARSRFQPYQSTRLSRYDAVS